MQDDRLGLKNSGPKKTMLQDVLDEIHLPSDVGAINFKVASGFDNMTAEQWRTFSTVVAPVWLKTVLNKLERDHHVVIEQEVRSMYLKVRVHLKSYV